MDISNELAKYSREDLIEEIARLRLVILKRNGKVCQDAKEFYKKDYELRLINLKDELIKDLKEIAFYNIESEEEAISKLNQRFEWQLS